MPKYENFNLDLQTTKDPSSKNYCDRDLSGDYDCKCSIVAPNGDIIIYNC